MRKRVLLGTIAAVLALLVATVAYANHQPPPLVANNVSLTNKAFNIGGDIYGGVKGVGITLTGAAAGGYEWTITNNDKTRHTFEVENETNDVHLPLNEGGATILNFPKGPSAQTANFTLASGNTYKVYCTLHEKSGMFFLLEVP